ncbi:hypothetical protein D3C78_1252080 [compost metagenome]
MLAAGGQPAAQRLGQVAGVGLGVRREIHVGAVVQVEVAGDVIADLAVQGAIELHVLALDHRRGILVRIAVQLRLDVEQAVRAGQLQHHLVGVADAHPQHLTGDDQLAALEGAAAGRLIGVIEPRQPGTGHALHRVDHRQRVQRRLAAGQGRQVVLLHDVAEEVQRARIHHRGLGGRSRRRRLRFAGEARAGLDGLRFARPVGEIQAEQEQRHRQCRHRDPAAGLAGEALDCPPARGAKPQRSAKH